MSDNIRIKVIIGSTRPGRFSERPAQYIYEELGKAPGVEVELLDLRDYPMPFYDALVPPARAGGKYDHPVVQRWADKIKEGDAFIVVTPEYNHGYPAVLKNAIDVLFPEWNYKVIGFVSYGNTGGSRAIEQLVQVVVELRMVPIGKSINVPIDVYRKAMHEQSIENSEAFTQLRHGFRGDDIEVFFNALIKMGKSLRATYRE